MRFRTLLVPFFAAFVAGGAAEPAADAPPAEASLIETTFVGQVEVTPDGGGEAVLVSTESEEVIVEPAEVAAELREVAGRQVRLHGWIVDRPQDDLVIAARERREIHVHDLPRARAQARLRDLAIVDRDPELAAGRPSNAQVERALAAQKWEHQARLRPSRRADRGAVDRPVGPDPRLPPAPRVLRAPGRSEVDEETCPPSHVGARERRRERMSDACPTFRSSAPRRDRGRARRIRGGAGAAARRDRERQEQERSHANHARVSRAKRPTKWRPDLVVRGAPGSSEIVLPAWRSDRASPESPKSRHAAPRTCGIKA